MLDSIHDYVLEQLQANKGRWPSIARDAGVPYGTLKKIVLRTSVSPRIDSLEKLATYFRRRAGERRHSSALTA